MDCYIVEIDTLDREGDIHQERSFTKVYQGPRTRYTLRGLDYNVTVLARVKALNTAGESEPSDEVSLSTEKGSWSQVSFLCLDVAVKFFFFVLNLSSFLKYGDQ